MALPKDTVRPLDQVRAANDKVSKAVNRLALVTEQAFQQFWGGSVEATLEQAEATNQFAIEAGTTVAEVFSEHGKAVDYCLACDASLSFSVPPVDLTKVFDLAGMLDIDKLRAELINQS